MADRYQDRPFPADDDYGRGHSPASAGDEGDPLAELARLIGQTDPFAVGRPSQPAAPRRDRHQPPAPVDADDGPAAGPPPWMRRVARQEAPPQEEPAEQDYPQDYPSAVHPLHRYAAQHAAPEPEYHPAPPSADAEYEPDPSRYDDALYGQVDPGPLALPREPAYPDDPFAYRDSYDEGAEEPAPKRGGGLVTVVVVLALALLGTGAAFAYRTYIGSPRSGEPPIIRADTGPTKIVPTPLDANAKLPDRMAPGDGTEKIVPREEAPVDVNAKSGPRVIFPPLNQNAGPPVASVAPASPPPATASNGTLPNSEPRRIRTLSVPADVTSGATAPVAAPAAKPPVAAAHAAAPPSQGVAATRSAPAPAANAPLSLSPQAALQPAPVAEPRTRMAANTPEPAAASNGGGSGYLVQVSSQRNEADAQASFRALQGKFPGVLGSRAPVIKRADLGEKGVYYRAMVGPFGSPDEASQFCGSLKTAGGQCVVQRN